MKIFDGKSPKERNQIIALVVIGGLAVLAVGYNFSGLFGSNRKSPQTASASPTATVSPLPAAQNPSMPAKSEVDFVYETTKVSYNPGDFNAPDPGRNIFAFYEPPRPTPYSPTPIPPPQTPKPATPTPTPPLFVAYSSPQSVYAGGPAFRLEVSGDRLTPDSIILFNGGQVRTNYLGPQGLAGDIPAGMITAAGTREVSVITPDGKWSNRVFLNVQEPPKPQVEYIGMMARKRYNNDTAYFEEKGKSSPIGARLNDVVGGRFRLKSISAEQVVFEDINLGFTHKLKMKRPVPGQSTGVGPPQPVDNTEFFTVPETINGIPAGAIPGIPNNIPRYVPTPLPTKDPADDSDDSDGKDDGG